MRRFIDRFHLWRHDRVDEFEDKFVGWLLFFAVLVIGQDAYTHLHYTSAHMERRSAHQSLWLSSYCNATVALGMAASHALRALLHRERTVRLRERHAARFCTSSVSCFGIHARLGIAAFIYSLIIRKRFARDI
jgi:hypothetical protein